MKGYSTSFDVQNILESNPRPVRCGWKTFSHSWMQLNENREIYGGRENTFYVWKPSRIELRYLELAVQLQSKLLGFQ
jgi:hypothetical protein